MKKKGFTLIELLAVIVILALIVIIAVPKILDVIEKSERTAWGESAGLMAKAAELKYSEGSITNTERDEIYEFENGDFKSGSPTLTFKGDKPYSGKIVQEKGKTTLALISKNKKWCAIKNTGERIAKVYKIGKEITEENCKIGYTGSSDDNKPEEYTCPDISTYPLKNLNVEAIPSVENKYKDAEEYYTFYINPETKTAELEESDSEKIISSNITNLIIPESITTPDGVKYAVDTINTGAIHISKKINKIVISPSVVTIKTHAFSYDGFKANFEELDLSYAVKLKELDGFSSATITKPIVINKCLKSLETIKAVAFTNATASDIVIKDAPKLVTIEKDALGGVKGNLTIKNVPNLTSIGSQISTSLTSLSLEDLPKLSSINFDQDLYYVNKLNLRNLPSLTKIDDRTFYGVGNYSEEILTINIENLNNLEIIGKSSFGMSHNTTNETILNLRNLPSLTTIDNNAFKGINITELNMIELDNLKTIGGSAFGNNKISSLSLNLPKLETIGESAFISNNISKINFDTPNLKTIGSGAFNSNAVIDNFDLTKCKNLEEVTNGFQSASIVNLNLSGLKDSAVKSALISSNLTSTLKNLNIANSGITSLDLSGYTALENINLNGCSELTSFMLNGNKKITTLDFSKYKNLNKLNTVTLYADTALQNLNLSGLSALTTVQMGNDPYTKLKIPASVTTISAPSTGTISCIEIEGDSTRFDSKFKDIFGVEKSSVASTCTFN